MLFHKRGKVMDKKMHKITKKIESAEKAMEHKNPKKAEKILKGAAKANEKLVKIDKNVRDPQVEKYKKMKKRGCA
jgi:anaerobic ribonucleoside-triphosphate reductase